MITVVIPTRNRAHLLLAALQSIAGQTLSKKLFEVLVIDNGSTDETAALVKKSGSAGLNLRYFYEPEPGLHVGRHRGMIEAKGDILVFADDDIEAFPSWLATIHELFCDPEVAMVGGNNLPMFLESPPSWLVKLWERPHPLGGKVLPALSILELDASKRSHNPFYVYGCNFAIRKKVLLQAGGFHPDGMPKELIRFRGDGETHVSRFIADSGMKCLFHSKASVHHKVTPERMSVDYFRQRGFNQGVSDSYTQLRDGQSPALLRRLLRTRWAASGLRVIRNCHDMFTRTPGERRALRALRQGHFDGFNYHQNVYQTDSEVRDWVHRKRYY